MIRPRLLEVHGVTELLGRGVYTALPAELPGALAGGAAVVVAGEPAAAAVAALRVDTHGCSVTLVLHESARDACLSPNLRAAFRQRPRISVRYGMELEWAAGTARLEALVLRHVASGRIEACNADALFVLTSGPGSESA